MAETSTRYYIWSYRKHQWWGPDRAGYTDNLLRAGLYTREEAASIVFNALPGQNIPVDTDLAHMIAYDPEHYPKGIEGALIGWRNF